MMGSRMSLRARAALATGALTSTLLAGAVVAAPTASSASYPTCNAQKMVSTSGGRFTYHPYYKATGSRNCVMGRGAQSDGVFPLQHAIEYCYKRDIAFDGIYGPQTEDGVWAIQRAEDVGRDGVYGPETRKAMKWPIYQGGVGHVGCSELGV
ncbi:murein L,D-transpeptidase YcbB/YkuD [Streptomyces africanus]|uniref:Murein L,D-transpeptidase YcbB/YkuD n=2 Tax=Streptomyces TaxID=1883 RepID=A0ABU0QTR0_9ACTN|nr:murein L,D-transpeptidase YcbB/YkuD [Streptomyces africanus]MDQ1016885.1 murein L,D-transpeptidase YcbB/YkuD [Streptomyces afghaniensis]